MLSAIFADWQLWAVAGGAALGTLLLRIIPLVARNRMGGEKIREFFDRAGYGILGGIVATSALRSGGNLFETQQTLGSAIAVACVIVAFLIAIWRGGTILPTIIGLAGFVTAGLIYLG